MDVLFLHAAILVLIPQDKKGPLLIGCCKITPDITPYGMLLDDRCVQSTAVGGQTLPLASNRHWQDIGTIYFIW